jgi:hypothetical protein
VDIGIIVLYKLHAVKHKEVQSGLQVAQERTENEESASDG